MKINFNNIHISNFLSIGDATIPLNDSGYTLINGINQNPDDLAKSNGSGKSTIFEAISFALTGETIRGSKDVVNIYGNDGALVELDFNIDKDNYKIVRTKEHSKLKTNLKIYINGEDKSGKGIRDSEKLLAEYIPDLTSSLLGSVIILGQGLPQRFTNNTPSGRKDVLEKLSKSDFMIQDIKDRISTRLSELKKELRKCEDNQLEYSVKDQSLQKQIAENKIKLESLSSNEVLQQSIDLLEGSILDCNIKLNTYNANLTEVLEKEKIANVNYNNKLQESNTEANLVKDKWESQIKATRDEYNIEKNNLKETWNTKANEIKAHWQFNIDEVKEIIITAETELKNKKAELVKLQNITDTCPTCGQKLPGVFKPDTASLEKELELLNGKLTECYLNRDELISKLNEELASAQTDYDTSVNNLDKDFTLKLNNLQASYDTELKAGKFKYQDELNKLYNNITDINKEITDIRVAIDTFSNKKTGYEQSLTGFKTELANLEATKKAAEDIINSASKELENIKVLVENNTLETNNVNNRLDIVNKMNNVITRDFRGYLLKNVIEFINKKAKEYSLEVFETDKIEFKLDGNNIIIGYDGKDYESLSGGERQKCDIIIQFAIRDMLCKYLDFSSNILVLDELMDNVDSVGADKLFNMISNKLTDVQSIFIISHHSDFSIPCDTQLTVIKDKNKISRIEYTI